MNKYIYSVCDSDGWPSLESIYGVSLQDAEDKIIMEYCDKYELETVDDYPQLQENLNSEYGVVISDLYDYEIL